MRQHIRAMYVSLALLLSCMLSFMAPHATQAASQFTSAEVSFTAQVNYSGDQAPEETFVVACMPTGEAPQPQEGTTQEVPLSFHTPTGEVSWSVSFDEPGVYTYELTQTQGTVEGISYDSTSYTVEVEVYLDYMELKSVVRVTRDGSEAEKTAQVSFDNTYQLPEPEPTPEPPAPKPSLIDRLLPKTSDPTSYVACAVAAVSALIFIALAVRGHLKDSSRV